MKILIREGVYFLVLDAYFRLGLRSDLLRRIRKGVETGPAGLDSLKGAKFRHFLTI